MICVAHIIFRFAFSCVCSVSLVRFPPVPVKPVPGVYQSAPSAVQVFLAVSSVYLYFVLWFHSALVSSFFFFFFVASVSIWFCSWLWWARSRFLFQKLVTMPSVLFTRMHICFLLFKKTGDLIDQIFFGGTWFWISAHIK